MTEPTLDITRIIAETRAYSCLDCGKCTATCPVSRYDSTYSPRQFVDGTLVRQNSAPAEDGHLWSCITCGACEARCPSGVGYTGLMKSLRAEAYSAGQSGQCTHGGALQSLMRMMANKSLRQDRLGWLKDTMKTSARGDVLYFVGCLPYFDVIFADLGVSTLDAARGAVKLMNQMGIVPAVLPDERCCGHDLLWSGDVENFKRLAEHNLKEISNARAKQVVTTCPECAHVLQNEYPRYFGNLDFTVVHFSQLLAGAVAGGKLKSRRLERKVTYHDPCRLGRFSGVFEEPREVIGATPGIELVEMPHNRDGALCCGTQAWMNCGAVNKQIQIERLREARATGAETLVTACPKCQIHLRCALSNGKEKGELPINIEDLTSLAARMLSAGEDA